MGHRYPTAWQCGVVRIQARGTFIKERAKQDDIALIIDSALKAIEGKNKVLEGALQDNYFSHMGLETPKLASLIDAIENIDTYVHEESANECDMIEEDLVGRVYKYFLGRFAATEGKEGGEFYTPKSVVTLLAEMLEPFQGKIYDPCCGSGGMFVQSLKFVESHQGKSKDIAIYGQELTTTTFKLAKINLAIRGLTERPADTFLLFNTLISKPISSWLTRRLTSKSGSSRPKRAFTRLPLLLHFECVI